MDVAALGTWLLTVLAGFYLLDTWLPEAGARKARRGNASGHPTSPLVDNVLAGAHMLCAIGGWLVWMFFVLDHVAAVGRVAVVLVTLTALLGLSMVSRWLPGRLRAGRLSRVASRTVPAPGAALRQAPTLSRIPIVPMLGHGLFAAATVVLVLVTVLSS